MRSGVRYGTHFFDLQLSAFGVAIFICFNTGHHNVRICYNLHNSLILMRWLPEYC